MTDSTNETWTCAGCEKSWPYQWTCSYKKCVNFGQRVEAPAEERRHNRCAHCGGPDGQHRDRCLTLPSADILRETRDPMRAPWESDRQPADITIAQSYAMALERCERLEAQRDAWEERFQLRCKAFDDLAMDMWRVVETNGSLEAQVAAGEALAEAGRKAMAALDNRKVAYDVYEALGEALAAWDKAKGGRTE